MTRTATANCTRTHRYDAGNPLAERNTRWAVWITAVMMVLEIAGGYLFNSMALLADGWHMGSHALALGLSVLAYGAARKLSGDGRFAFGTWKIEILGGYTSALFLVAMALLMLYQSVERLFAPTPIHYEQAMAVAALGLAVNLVCAWLLKDGHHHHHGHDHGHNHHDDHDHEPGHHDHHGHHDLNLRHNIICTSLFPRAPVPHPIVVFSPSPPPPPPTPTSSRQTVVALALKWRAVE